MKLKELENVGLTEGEGKVYLALLRLGSSTTGKIIQDSGVSNSKVYEILERLSKKGLVGRVSVNNTKYFEAKKPERLRELMYIEEERLKERKREVNELIPRLNKVYNESESEQEAEILEGVNGIKTFSELILSKAGEGDTLYIMGAPKESNEILGAYFKDWHKRRVKKKVHAKLLYNFNARHYAEDRSNLPRTEIKVLPRNIETPALIDISENYVATILFGERPLCIVVKNKKISKSYRSYFDLLWRSSKN